MTNIPQNSQSVAMLRKAFLFFFTQACAQAINVCAGLLVVRLLDYEDYALYVFVGALIGFGVVSSDLGTGQSIRTLASRANNENDRSKFFCEANRLRKIFLVVSVLVVSVVFFSFYNIYSGIKIDQYILSFLVMISIMILQNFALLRRSYLAAERNLSVINRADPFGALLRLVLIGLMFIGGWSNVVATLGAWALSAALIFFWLHSNVRIEKRDKSPKYRKLILDFIKPLFPEKAYFVLQGMLPILGLSWFAATQDVAELGALGRLGLAAGLFGPLIGYVAQPYVARSADRSFVRHSLAVLGIVATIGVVLVLSGVAVPNLWLILLGERYAHLEDYVWLALVVASLNLFYAAVYTMVLASGETRFQVLAVLVGIATQALLLVVAPIRDLDSAYVFMIVTSGATIIAQCGLFVRAGMRVSRRRGYLGDGSAPS